MSEDVGSVDPTMLGTAALSSQTCLTDYVIIPAPALADGTNPFLSDRFCGLGFPGVQSRSKPFVIYAVTDANENLDISNRGFYLTYSQIACPV